MVLYKSVYQSAKVLSFFILKEIIEDKECRTLTFYKNIHNFYFSVLGVFSVMFLKRGSSGILPHTLLLCCLTNAITLTTPSIALPLGPSTTPIQVPTPYCYLEWDN